jgi:C4-dicarboxylate transporter DctM subunit
MEHLEVQLKAIRETACIEVVPYGTLTVGEMGEVLADHDALAPHVCAFSDDGRGVQSDEMMLAAMKQIKKQIKNEIKDIPGILVESAVSTAVVYMTIAGAGVLSQVLVRLHFQTEVRDFAINVLQNPALVAAFLFGVFIILGMFLDPTVIIAMFAPTVLAIGNALGYDPIHFGVLMVIIMQLGAITPPVGTFLFISCGVAKLPMEQSVKPLLPYIATVIIIFILGFLVPEIVTWLPGLIYG